jgi:Fic family protein
VATAWEDPPGCEALIEANVRRVLAEIARRAYQREQPTVAQAKRWHRDLYDKIARPFDYFAGEVRDSDHRFPQLIGYEVEVDGMQGVASELVPAALAQFEDRAQAAVARLDAAIPQGTASHALDTAQLHGILTLCALLHGEWVRIHPYANGNGRTARLWANWAALRYGLPPFVTIKPRPNQPYGAAALASMHADHSVMLAVLHEMLRAYLENL